MTSKQCTNFRRILVIGLGMLFIFCGIYLFLYWIEIFTILRGKEMSLKPDSESFKGWKNSPLPLNFDVYLFNWTNPEDFYNGSKRKPRFEQLGPYRFREIYDKVDLDWHNQNYSISYRKKSTFFFDPVGSNGTLQDYITSVDAVAYQSAVESMTAGVFKRFGIFNALSKRRPYVTKTADEWIFKGYKDSLVSAGNLIKKFVPTIDIPYDRVGYLYTRNDSAAFDGHFNMFTGVDDIRKMGQVYTWNYQNRTGRFNGTCGEVKGSMGEFFPPNLTTNDTITMFISNICRSVPLDYTETTEIHGVKAFKFSGTERVVDNGTLFPEAKCFCVNGKCERAGVFSISPCKYNSPVFMSYPHFYKADPYYLEAVEGLKPDKEKHEFFMTLEPNTGVPLDVGGGFQANFLLETIPKTAPFDNIPPKTFIPMIWCEERVRVTAEIADDVALVPFIILMGQVVTGALLALGIILLCWYPTKHITSLLHDPKAKQALMPPMLLTFPLGEPWRSSINTRSTPMENIKILPSSNRPNSTIKDSLLNNTVDEHE